MTYLVTGGTGFVGSYLAKELANRGENVVVFDQVIRHQPNSEFYDDMEVVQGDVSSLEDVLDAVRKFDITRIVHLAYLLMPESESNIARAMRVNVDGFRNIFEAARLADVERIVWPSSVSAYGLSTNHVGTITEDAPLKPILFYGACKVFNEEVARHYHRLYGLDYMALRYGSVYGPGRQRGFSAFMVDLIEKPAVGEPVKIELGDESLNWVYIKDAVRATVLACTVKETKNRVFNIVGEAKSVREVADYIRKLLPHSKIELLLGKIGRQVQFDGTRAHLELGYKPEYSVERGVREHINIVRKQRDLPPV